VILATIFGSLLLLLSARLQATATGTTDGDQAFTAKVPAAESTIFIPMIRDGREPPPTVHLREIATASEVTDLQHAGDERLFIVEQAGRIRLYDGKQVGATPFLDISDRVESGGERGLLGLAFHPEYSNNGTFYVNYTTAVDGSLQTRVSRFSVDGGNPNLADSESEQVLLAFGQPYSNHNGGAIAFGPDGYLYVAVGDGGSSYDPNDEGQDSGTILGTLLRLDVDGGNGHPPDCDQSGNDLYRIPADNPLADGAGGACDEIWAWGLRNPWRFSFDRATGDMWIADVGQSAWEEVNFEPAGDPGGRNYGWDCYEGDQANPVDPAEACTDNNADYVFPVHAYGHDNSRCSVTGGYVYRGSAYEALQGRYVFADFCTGEMWTLSGSPLSPTVTALTTTGETLSLARTFGQDVDGELYVAGNSAVYRIEAPAAATGTKR
jgi:glucose/arabinose dehydrogenase